MTRILTLAIAAGLAAVPFVVRADDAKTSPTTKPVDKGDTGASLVGGYTIVAGEQSGKPLPADKFEGSVVRFTEDEVIGTDKEKKQIFVAKYTLDTAKTPWVINMKSTHPKEGEATGLIEKTGDTVRIIYNLPGGKAPDDFKTDDKQNLFVLKNTVKNRAGERRDK